MYKFGLVGYGKWGKILKKNLEHFGEIIFISNTKKTYKVKKKINFCFIASSDNSHYKITKYFLEKKIPVFCEKPLTRNLNKCHQLINLSKRYKTPLYIDHIELFKNKIIIPKRINFIERKKKTDDDIKDVLWKLCYHDLYLLYDILKKGKLYIKLLYKDKKKIKFKIINRKKEYNFYYDFDSDYKIHRINNVNLLSKINYLKMMISDVIRYNVNFKINNQQAIFCVKTILEINKKIFK